MASEIIQIPDKATHDKIVDESADTPTIIYVSNSALPICRNFTPKYEDLAKKYNKSTEGQRSIRFTQLDFSGETSAMFKFSPNQLPVVVFMCKGPWSRTMMSPNIEQMEEGIEQLLEKAGKWRN